MEMIPLGIEGAWLARSPIWKDERGSFREWFKVSEVQLATKINFDVQQSNISNSKLGVVRGIHYSLTLGGQAKWVTCVTGFTRDVIVDIRPSSPTFGKYVAVDLSGNSGDAVFIASDLGHGFVSLEENSTVAYLVSSPFSPDEEFAINPLDPAIGIDWGIPVRELLLSPKDLEAPSLVERRDQGKLPS
jgi:dTDP-4-dehydrorhamnose 3,5-epimerase